MHYKRRSATIFSPLLNHIHLTFEVTTCEITQFNIAYLTFRPHFADHNIPCALVSNTVLNK